MILMIVIIVEFYFILGLLIFHQDMKRQRDKEILNGEYWRKEYIHQYNLMNKYGPCADKMLEFDKWLELNKKVEEK